MSGTFACDEIWTNAIAVANDLEKAYGFTSFQSGLCFIGSLVGGILGSQCLCHTILFLYTVLIMLIVPAGGPVGEAVANYFTIRNKGVREPEFRLPAIAISVVTAPLSLILYGVGIQNKMHFMVPVLGLSLRKSLQKLMYHIY